MGKNYKLVLLDWCRRDRPLALGETFAIRNLDTKQSWKFLREGETRKEN